MQQGCARLLHVGNAICQRASQSAQRSFSVSHPSLSYGQRDFALPNATWNPNTRELYNRYLELSESGAWRRISSFNATVHHLEGKPPEARRDSRLFTRNLDKDGVGFEYSMFFNKAEKRMICIFQPGAYLEGPPGYTHGGCIATIIDSTAGAGAVYDCGRVMTANLNINYKNVRTGRTMQQGCARLLRVGNAICQRASQSAQRSFSVSHPSLSYGQRDFALPNATWNPNTRELYNRYLELSESGAWRRISSFDTFLHHFEGKPPEARRDSRLFTRHLDKDGVGFEYSMFFNKAEKRMICIFQPGAYLEGPPGYTHGGCIATIIDTTAVTGAVYSCGRVMTANLNINYKNPIPMGTTVLVDSNIEKEDGRKVYGRCQIRSHNDLILHADATVLFIKLESTGHGSVV
ncbi:acyl-coenzyme A thioesterase THEM4-like [Pseudophryne corroboree]|uniref:acyl-coenzyme A thioesterase THEM4-like n=1 Tax=Pseudophryne corroboree TaxID=495146 RepID=UPI003081601E